VPTPLPETPEKQNEDFLLAVHTTQEHPLRLRDPAGGRIFGGVSCELVVEFPCGALIVEVLSSAEVRSPF